VYTPQAQAQPESQEVYGGSALAVANRGICSAIKSEGLTNAEDTYVPGSLDQAYH